MIVNSIFEKIIIERKPKPVGRVINIKSIPKILKIELEDEHRGLLKISFEFEIIYNPNLANIKMVGFLIYSTEKWKKIVESWKKNKKIEGFADVKIKNFLLSKCLILLLKIIEDFKLPPPIPLPRFIPRKKVQVRKIKKEDLKYIG